MWKVLKQLLVRDDEKVFILEDGKPRYVVLSVSEYLRLRSAQRRSGQPERMDDPLGPERSQPPESLPPSLIDDMNGPNGEISSAYETEEPLRSQESPPEISLEDLPL